MRLGTADFRARFRGRRAAEEQVVEHLDGVGDVDRGVIVRVRGLQAHRSFRSQKKKTQDLDSIRDVGHAVGARIATTLIHAMIARDANVGLATMCIGVGQGIAALFEKVAA